MMNDKATKKEMYQEAKSRLEILVKHGVDERVIEHFEQGILWAYSRYEDIGEIEGMFPAEPYHAQLMKQIDDASDGTYLTYCLCYLHQSKGRDPQYCQITVGNNKLAWTEERKYLLQTCSYLTPMDKEVLDGYVQNAEGFYEILEHFGGQVFAVPAA